MHDSRTESQHPAHLFIEARVSLVTVGVVLARRRGAARSVRVDEVKGEALGEEPDVGTHEPRRHPWPADEREQRLAATDELIGRHPAVGKSYLHELWLSSVVVSLPSLELGRATVHGGHGPEALCTFGNDDVPLLQGFAWRTSL